MVIIPEHVIISDNIAANGYREVTLRTRPKIPGKSVFGFYIVEGGLNQHPELDSAWETGVEVTGSVYTVKGEKFIRISAIRKLTKVEQKIKSKMDEKLWRQIC